MCFENEGIHPVTTISKKDSPSSIHQGMYIIELTATGSSDSQGKQS
jgi:hypothetical protein